MVHGIRFGNGAAGAVAGGLPMNTSASAPLGLPAATPGVSTDTFSAVPLADNTSTTLSPTTVAQGATTTTGTANNQALGLEQTANAPAGQTPADLTAAVGGPQALNTDQTAAAVSATGVPTADYFSTSTMTAPPAASPLVTTTSGDLSAAFSPANVTTTAPASVATSAPSGTVTDNAAGGGPATHATTMSYYA